MITKKSRDCTDNLYFHPCCGGRDRTTDLQVMSLTSYHCSTPRYIFLSKSGAKVLLFFGMTKYFRTFFTFLTENSRFFPC